MKLIFSALIFILLGCSTQKATEHNYNFIKMKGSFKMEIMFYSPATPCGGGRAYASNCIGRTMTNDTLRVLTLCNTDTTFERGQLVTILVKEKPNYFVIASEILLGNSQGQIWTDTEFINTPTIYGEMQK